MPDETEHIDVTRDEIIQHLTGSMFDSMEQDAEYRWDICKRGHQGFDHMSNDELLKEYRDYISEDPNYPVVITLKEQS